MGPFGQWPKALSGTGGASVGCYGYGRRGVMAPERRLSTGGGQRGAVAEAGAGRAEGRRRGAAGRGRQRRARGAGAQGGLRAHGEAGDDAAAAVGRSKRRASARRVGRRGQPQNVYKKRIKKIKYIKNIINN